MLADVNAPLVPVHHSIETHDEPACDLKQQMPTHPVPLTFCPTFLVLFPLFILLPLRGCSAGREGVAQ